MWYDEGIELTKPWHEEIRESLQDCAFFVVFLSPNAISSINVQNEINMALNKHKSLLVIYLEETPLTAGLELRISMTQALFKNQMRLASYQRKIFQTLPSETKADNG
ncbi:MAG: toll/interleukin-1 receptor domain-containing protein [Promethearchaeota archaeon]